MGLFLGILLNYDDVNLLITLLRIVLKVVAKL